MRLALLSLSLLAIGNACAAQQPTGTPDNAAPAAREATPGRANLPKTPPPGTVTEIGRFASPFAMAFLPDGALLVTEKAGILRLRRADGQVVAVTGVPVVAKGGQGGLLGVAPAPDVARSGLVYLTYSEAVEGGNQLTMARGKLVMGATPRLDDVRILWRSGSAGKGGQYGATIAFAPDGKSLYLASGERQRFTPAQDPDQALGKILHLTLDGKPAPGNPLAGKTGAATVTVTDPPRDTAAAATATARTVAARTPNTTPAETWSSGHRNPYGTLFTPDGRLWEEEMGPKGGDELNLIVRGRNYGWPRVSNGDNYDGLDIPNHRAGDGFEAPKLWWNPSISPGGMIYYTGALFPALRGSLLIAELSGQGVAQVQVRGDAAHAVAEWDMGTRIRDLAQAPDGSIWLLGDDGALMRLTPKG